MARKDLLGYDHFSSPSHPVYLSHLFVFPCHHPRCPVSDGVNPDRARAIHIAKREKS